jgi:(p)ppGpp synthase/HD superfamily hydrolase
MNTDQLDKCELLAMTAHLHQKYGVYEPYSYHLYAVYKEAVHWLAHIDIPTEDKNDIYAACFLHDTLEDTNVSYNDIKRVAGEKVADIVYDVTNELGKNRRERCERTYPKTAKNELAVFVKLCDRIANIRHGIGTGSNMLEMYRKEYESFRAYLRNPDHKLCKNLWLELDFLLQ